MALLALENLSFRYPGCEKQALDGVSLEIERGEFIAVCGATGSGKTTLLRMLKRELRPLGELGGAVRLLGEELDSLPERVSASKIGFVMQRPEQQLVSDKVWHELAFGLENLGVPTDTIRRRVAEMSAYFGIESWFERSVSELSGGQKQLLNLAAVMVMQPEVLILDEPTAQLDPIAASDFIATVRKLNRELSLTVLIAEHRLEEVVPEADKLLALENGRLLAFAKPSEALKALRGHAALTAGMPAAARLAEALGEDSRPLTVREGRALVENGYLHGVRSLPEPEPMAKAEPALEFSDVWFRYGRELPDVLRGLNAKIMRGEIFCLLGGNGSGKSTALCAAAGLNKIYAGSIRVFGKKLKDYKESSLYKNCLSMLPQDVQTVFLKNTVREELADVGADAAAFPIDLSPLLAKHPYDLSGGEQQLVAMAKIMASDPRLLLLDEPTKGLDAAAKHTIGEVLLSLRARGVTSVVVTHDVEFAAGIADRCALFFRGEIASCEAPRRFFAENSFYTTAANRMTRGFYDGVVTVEDAAELCRLNGKRGAANADD